MAGDGRHDHQLTSGRFGLLFSGGGCIDGDSDAFHHIGYAW
jgi:hypothetical protein